MRVYRTLAAAGGAARPFVVAIGAFDGLHRGHQAVIAAARALAGARAAEVWALTFDPHPQKVLRPAEAPPLLLTPAYKLQVLQDLGLDAALLVPFTPELSRLEPRTFAVRVREALPSLLGAAVGENWRFGHEARGDAPLLAALGRELGFAVAIVPRVLFGDEPVSSSRIRAAVARGGVEEAAAMLGRPFRVEGIVRAGRGAGRALGFPTANVTPENELRPAPGIYAARIHDGPSVHPAAAYLGPGAASADIVEVHLLGFDGDLYGRRLAVDFVSRVREDRRFPSADALRTQIARDVEEIRRRLSAGA